MAAAGPAQPQPLSSPDYGTVSGGSQVERLVHEVEIERITLDDD